MDADIFESELGRVAVTDTHLEREERTSREGKGWEKIKEMEPSGNVVDTIHFSRIEGIEEQPETFLPYIRLKVNGDWKKFFLSPNDDFDRIYRRINYRWRAFRENY